MPISVQPNQIASPHWLIFKTNEKVNDRDVYFISVSGVAVLNFKGNSANWLRDELDIQVSIPIDKIPLPPIPGPDYYPQYKCKHWVVFASLNAIFNQDHAVNSGHAVDSFRLDIPANAVVNKVIGIKAQIGVRDTDAYLYRVGYKVDLLVYFDKYNKIVID